MKLRTASRAPSTAARAPLSFSKGEKREAGTKKPSGAALKLLSVVQKQGLAVLAD